MAHTDRPPVERALIRTVILAVVALVAVAGLTLALVAVERQVGVAQCINANLGERNATSGSDAQAHIDFVHALNAALALPPGPAQDKAVQNFLAVSKTSEATLKTNADIRAAHPLGRC